MQNETPEYKPERKLERRSKHRYAIERELRFKLLDDDRIVGTGTGETVDISSGGVAFRVGQRLDPGALVELSISWPAVLGESCLMRLVILGRVLRSGERAAASIERYEFRTQGRVFSPSPWVRADSTLRRWIQATAKDGKNASAIV